MTHSLSQLNSIGVFHWESIADSFDDANLFLGNGFSISLCNRLSYNSLFDKFRLSAGKELLEIFTIFKTHNFELIIQILKNSESINKILDQPSEKIEPLIIKLREGLIKSIQENHPSHSEINYSQLFALGTELMEFKDIFTTNYDVFLYKTILQIISDCQDKKYKIPYQDCFYEEISATELKFSNIKPYQDARNVYYLHGALFIYNYKNQGSSYKLRRLEQIRLEYVQLIKREIDNNNFPIFVAEGDSDDKLNTIHNNIYLNFCAGELMKSVRNIVFYGFSFGDSDKHIIDFVKKSKIKK